MTFISKILSKDTQNSLLNDGYPMLECLELCVSTTLSNGEDVVVQIVSPDSVSKGR